MIGSMAITYFYSLEETQKATELSCPFLGSVFPIAIRRTSYEFFSSAREAQDFSRTLKQKYQHLNPTLEQEARSTTLYLKGRILEHQRPNLFEISHVVSHQPMPFFSSIKELGSLLKSPRGRKLEDRRGAPPPIQII